MSLKDLSLHYGKSQYYFRNDTGIGKEIRLRYGEITIDTIEEFNNRCSYLVSLVNNALVNNLVSKKELLKAVYGERAQYSVLTNGLLLTSYYRDYEFVKSTTLFNLEKAEKFILSKLEVYKKIVSGE